MIPWMLIGAVLGLAAALKKGFNVAGGILGGLLLGPLAFLMFLVSGVSAADANRKKCPHCAEWIKGEAIACKHCGRDVGPAVIAHAPTVSRCPKCGYDMPAGGACAQCAP